MRLSAPAPEIGKRVHLSAAAQIGGVLEPINAAPVIIEDDVLVGGNAAATKVRWYAPGQFLGQAQSSRAPRPSMIWSGRGLPRHRRRTAPEVPENAVVVPGSRAVSKGKAAEWNLSLYTPVIVKYRDEKTDQGIELEEWRP